MHTLSSDSWVDYLIYILLQAKSLFELNVRITSCLGEMANELIYT